MRLKNERGEDGKSKGRVERRGRMLEPPKFLDPMPPMMRLATEKHEAFNKQISI